MSYAVQLHDKLYHSIEKALINLESYHQNLAEKPYDLLDKSEKLKPASTKLRNFQNDLIHKAYRGTRDLAEMQRQLGEQCLTMGGMLH